MAPTTSIPSQHSTILLLFHIITYIYKHITIRAPPRPPPPTTAAEGKSPNRGNERRTRALVAANEWLDGWRYLNLNITSVQYVHTLSPLASRPPHKETSCQQQRSALPQLYDTNHLMANSCPPSRTACANCGVVLCKERRCQFYFIKHDQRSSVVRASDRMTERGGVNIVQAG